MAKQSKQPLSPSPAPHPHADKIARLEHELWHAERQHCRDDSERRLVADQCANLRRDIETLRAGHYVGRR